MLTYWLIMLLEAWQRGQTTSISAGGNAYCCTRSLCVHGDVSGSMTHALVHEDAPKRSTEARTWRSVVSTGSGVDQVCRDWVATETM
jgi:hypothetical protein